VEGVNNSFSIPLFKQNAVWSQQYVKASETSTYKTIAYEYISCVKVG
jgi:hypothetical protein